MSANLKAVWPMTLEAPEGSLEAKRPAIDNGLDVPDPSRYYSREYMDREWALMWPRVWLLAGVASDIPEDGDYRTFELGREEFLLVRQAERLHQGFLQRMSASRQPCRTERARQRRAVHLRVPRLAIPLRRPTEVHHGRALVRA